jgi:RHH-type rel operon transcriptional repressor/antitoxin RelB
MLTIRLPVELEQRIALLAKATQRPKSFYVREALERSLAGIEDAYFAEAAYEIYRSDGEKAILLGVAMKQQGMES